MSNRDRAAEVLRQTLSGGFGDLANWFPAADALIAAGLIHVGQGFCTKVPNCRLADGHAAGCERT